MFRLEPTLVCESGRSDSGQSDVVRLRPKIWVMNFHQSQAILSWKERNTRNTRNTRNNWNTWKKEKQKQKRMGLERWRLKRMGLERWRLEPSKSGSPKEWRPELSSCFSSPRPQSSFFHLSVCFFSWSCGCSSRPGRWRFTK